MGTLKKILTTGMGAALMTENGIRSAISDMKFRETIARQVVKGKDELTRVLAAEIKRFLDHIDIHEEIQKVISGMTIEIQAKVKLMPESSKKETRMTVRRLKVKKL